MKIKNMPNIAATILVSIICLNPLIASASSSGYPASDEEKSRSETGTIFGKDIVLYKSSSDNNYQVNKPKSITRNKAREILWHAAREVLKNMPTQVADYNSGIIITDWYISRFQPNYSFKIEVAFEAKDELKIRIFERKLEKGQWYNEPENPKLVQKYLAMIEEQAKEIMKAKKNKK
ncbi:MAG: DUF3576 domain-containing protein [Rickettsiaceae bacterium]|nr:DUF3576 domain-containing protein [Rickettsiaceae bacterium]